MLSLLAVLGCSGTSSTSGTSGTSGTPGSTSDTGAPCAGSAPVPYPDGSPSGFEQCADGRIHRVTDLPNVGVVSGLCTDPGTTSSCQDQSGCDAGEVCAQWGVGIYYTPPSCSCSATCASDTDCRKNEACIGAGAIPTVFGWPACLEAECRTDADCASGLCGAAPFHGGCGHSTVLACRTAGDTCQTDADCDTDSGCFPSGGIWACARLSSCTL